jgi:hypothetical protein
VPVDATSVRLPVRLSAAAGPGEWMDVEVRLDGMPVSLVRAEAGAWRDAVFMVPKTAAPRPFRSVLVVVVGASALARGSDARVQLGVPFVAQAGVLRRP